MIDSWPPTVMVARLRDVSRLLVEVPPELRSSSAPKRPLEVTAKVVFSRRDLLNGLRRKTIKRVRSSINPSDKGNKNEDHKISIL